MRQTETWDRSMHFENELDARVIRLSTPSYSIHKLQPPKTPGDKRQSESGDRSSAVDLSCVRDDVGTDDRRQISRAIALVILPEPSLRDRAN